MKVKWFPVLIFKSGVLPSCFTIISIKFGLYVLKLELRTSVLSMCDKNEKNYINK